MAFSCPVVRLLTNLFLPLLSRQSTIVSLFPTPPYVTPTLLAVHGIFSHTLKLIVHTNIAYPCLCQSRVISLWREGVVSAVFDSPFHIRASVYPHNPCLDTSIGL